MQTITLLPDALVPGHGLLWLRLPNGAVACFSPEEVAPVPSPIGSVAGMRLHALMKHGGHWDEVNGIILRAGEQP